MTQLITHSVRSAVLLLSLSFPYAHAGTVLITSPQPGSTVSGNLTFTANAPGAASVDYWIAGHSVVTGQLPASAPYTTTIDTKTLWDGPVQFVAVARDAAGNIVGVSQPVSVILNNFNKTQVRLLSPDLSQTLSGQVTFQTYAADPRNVQGFVYSIDGKETPHVCNCGPFYTDTFSVDTTSLSNGTHYLVIEIIPADPGDGNPAQGVANVVTQFTVSNGRAPVELRSNIRYVYFQAGNSAPVQLAPHLIFNDGFDQPVSGASFASDNPSAANVSGTGLITAGPQQGIANVTISSGGRTTTVMITNMTSRAGFPHFTKDGKVAYAYDSSRSLWVRTLFFTSAQLFYTYDQSPQIGSAGFASALHQAGVNAINSNFYSNPSDDGSPDLATWENILGPRIQSWLDAARNNGFGFVGTGDDIQRNPAEMSTTTTSPWAADAIRYTLSKMAASGNVISLEMQDEVGGAVTPDFRQVMSILNTAPSRPLLTWPPAGLQSGGIFSAWMGDASMSDYSSLYWTYPFNFRPEFSWGNSLWETKNTLDKTVLGKLSGLQLDKPKYMEVQSTGAAYFKHASGDHYQFGADELQIAPTSPEELTAEILYAAATGFSGIRAYGYDGASQSAYGVTDGNWAYRRAVDPASADTSSFEQTGASPFSNLQEVKDRWKALSNGFNLIQTLEPYLLSPQINAIDLGSCIVTGARQAGSGRILIAVNMCDNITRVNADLSSYSYPAAATVTRHHVAGLMSASETVSNASSPSLTLAPGEAVVWVFTPGVVVQPPPAPAPDTIPPSVSLISPLANQAVSGSITLAALAFDNVGVTGVQFKVDGQNTGSALTAAPYTMTLDTTKLSNSNHLISVVAADAAGNQGTAGPIAITVNNLVLPPVAGTCAVAPLIPPAPVVTPASGLSAEWPLADAAGTIAAETSGGNRPLTLYGNPAWVNGPLCKLAACLLFNGATQSAQANLDLSGTRTITVSFWMNVPRYTNSDGLALEFSSSMYGFNGSNGGFMIDPNSSQNGGGFFEAGLKGDAGYNQVIFNRPSPAAWHFYAIVFDKSAPAATQVVPYVDGLPVPYTKMTNAANTNAFANDTLNIMSRNGQALFSMGFLQDVRVYNRALEALEIGALAAAGGH